MVSISWGEMASWIGSLLWPFTRISAMLMTAPITGARNMPMRLRLAMGLALTVVVAPMLPPAPAVDPFSLPAVLITFQQLAIGVAMGMGMQLLFAAFTTGGQIIAMQMGLGFASMVDPQNGQQVPVLSQFYLMFATLLFIGMNGHLVLIQMLMDSFRTLPIGPTGIDANGFRQLVAWGSHMFSGAVWLAIPATASLLVVNLSFGIMAKAAPQMNIFAVGFPVTMIMGFLVLLTVLPAVVPQFTTLVDNVFAMLRALVHMGS